ncbi:hypothetical protein PFISCL1PPCAC_12961 [Pristionchus fissidentatus]|uniref:Uncharacterized protein n=1 Tax=Pristionchus fissidentatus TaxID=1538716 RepID=A0AAV5VQ46_9BILA|nr:hypothetical protein PFISCL1PPCAC_12961 [Pristionchus fissidentatus]
MRWARLICQECGIEVDGNSFCRPDLIYSFFIGAMKRVVATEVSAVMQELTLTPNPEHVNSFVLEAMVSNPENEEDADYDIVLSYID